MTIDQMSWKDIDALKHELISLEEMFRDGLRRIGQIKFDVEASIRRKPLDE